MTGNTTMGQNDTGRNVVLKTQNLRPERRRRKWGFTKSRKTRGTGLHCTFGVGRFFYTKQTGYVPTSITNIKQGL